MISKPESLELEQLIHQLQPNCIINSRIGNGLGDYLVSEQQISAAKMTKPWEACITMSGKWSYNRYDKAWKSPELLIRQLVEIVCKGGNFLLNVNPDGQGALPQQSVDNLKAIGDWMKVNEEAIYGTQPWTVTTESLPLEASVGPKAVTGLVDTDNDNTVKGITPDIYFAQKNRVIYVYARSWSAGDMLIKSLGKIATPVQAVSLLGSKEKVQWKQDSGMLSVKLPAKLPIGIPVYVFKVTI